MIDRGVCLAGIGAVTALGRDALSTAAAIRAGVSGFSQHPFMVDTTSEPMRTAAVPWLDIDVPLRERHEALLFPAIDEALEPLIERLRPESRVALALALPAPRPGLPADLGTELRAAVTRRYRSLFTALAMLPSGHAASLLGMDVAVRKIQAGEYEACVVAGVDSYIEPETLEWIEANDQLHSAGVLNNAWGYVPGEAAGAVLLMTSAAADRFGCAPLGALLGVGTAVEQNRIKTETVCIGTGLTEAFRRALASLPAGATVTDIYCDMNGEPYRADEFGFATVRTNDSFTDAGEFQAPADCWGDVGAASGALLAAVATIADRKAYANGPFSLVWASSEGGERAAALLQFDGRT